MCAIVTIMIAQTHFSSLRHAHDRKNISSRTNGQVAARRVTGLIIKRLWVDIAALTMCRSVGEIGKLSSVSPSNA